MSFLPSKAIAPTLVLLAFVPLTSCGSYPPTAAAPPKPSGPEYWSPQVFATEDRTYSPTIHTVQLYKEGFELAAPVIELGGTDALVLRFDDLQPNVENLSYTLVHCTHDWVPTDLLPGQYLEGAYNAYLPAGRTSYNTLQPFIHYELVVPNADMRPMRSGNYILKVYRGGDEEDLVLTRRFLVFEPRTSIDARIVGTRQVDLRDAAQQLDLVVNTNNLAVQDPFGDIHVALLQNMRWADLRTGLRPRFVRGSELVYDFPPEGMFMGGNEYRNFDLKNLRYATQRVERIVPGVGERIYEAWLYPEERRTIRRYNNQRDLNGRYLVRNDQVDGDPLGADYVNVHFKLPMPAPMNSEVYVYGGLSDFQCKKDFRMNYSVEDTAYTASILLKQGFYDFSFVTLSRNDTTPDITEIEGSHFQTENEYLVMVYFTDRMQRCDRLVGVRFVNSQH
ncbi:MAG: DUF5103 domain-containing protein [Flavobacteriales bacterium]|nr:DUF5103 domain-containing protein [Flavobacteriales bacterium]MCC6938162.1 DUF5103 domain-containing protein [Flavobacteriales bacterium]